MENLMQLAMQMLLCLLIASILGGIIGYLLGKMSKCDHDETLDPRIKGKKLHDYNAKGSLESDTAYDATLAQGVKKADAAHEKSILKTTHVVGSAAATDTHGHANTTAHHAVGQEIGIRPSAMNWPSDNAMDDLKEISGVGLKLEELLHNLGIFSFEQVASWSKDNIDWMENYLDVKGRILKEDWISQAKLLAAGGQTAHSKKVKSGENKNYK